MPVIVEVEMLESRHADFMQHDQLFDLPCRVRYAGISTRVSKMASVRKRTWGRKSAYVVDYIDLDGKRRLQTFKSERAAEVFKTAMVYALQVDAAISTNPPPATAAPKPAPDGFDLLWGADAIGHAIGATRRQAFYLLEQGRLPAKKVGGRWVAERKNLERSFY